MPEGAALTAAVVELSRAYNGLPGATSTRGPRALAARLRFSFPRDVAKGACAVAELVAAGALAGNVRVLDVGAGLGAMTLGVALALARAHKTGSIDAVWVDEDADAMDVGRAVVAHAGAVGGVGLRVTAASQRDARATSGRDFDLVLAGQVLSEMDTGDDEPARAAAHAEWLEALLRERVSDHGSLVVVEPALRDRTRHLHRVRDALVTRKGVTLFSPCLHAEPCPALASPHDWCHEDRAIDLPEWLAPLAKAAGLRWQGLTFTYLVLRKDGLTLREAVRARGGVARVVSAPLVSKGKRELSLCGEFRAGDRTVSLRRKVALLDRETRGRDAWDGAERGDLLSFDPPLDADAHRVRPEETAISKGSVDAARGSG